VSGPGAFLNSRIEFSARPGADLEHRLDVARADIGRHLGLRAVSAEHYLPGAAIRQKIDALVDRSESEPRDVFDLDLLFGQFPDAVARGDISPERLERGAAIALGLPFEACRELVVDFVEDDFVPILEREAVWDEMRLAVAGQLERLR
jgi:hypothetical protein